jgi:hypothetical protein
MLLIERHPRHRRARWWDSQHHEPKRYGGVVVLELVRPKRGWGVVVFELIRRRIFELTRRRTRRRERF